MGQSRRSSHLPGIHEPPRRATARLLIVGGGPRAAMVLERLAVNHRATKAGPLHIDVVDPFPPGAGRIWRSDQSPLLKLNSMAMDVSMFTDESVTCDGPAVPGPSLWEWVCQVRAGSHPDFTSTLLDPRNELYDEVSTLTARDFPTRRLTSRYLVWFLEQTVAGLGDGIEIVFHEDTVVDIAPGTGELLHRAVLESGLVLQADQVVLALGHTDAQPGADSLRLSRFAEKHRHALTHVPPAYTNDVDLSGIGPGTDVLVSGMGLAFVDLFVLLMQGRGGSFERQPDGSLKYISCGKEPRLLVGSRRGVPYLSKIRGGLRGLPGQGFSFLTPRAVGALRRKHGLLDFRAHLWPLIAKEAGYSYYRELFTAYPDRVAMPWAQFAARFEPMDWYSPEREALVGWAVPDSSDQLDFEALDHPLAAVDLGTPEQIHAAVRERIERDLELRDGGENSETFGLFMGLLGCYMQLGLLISLDEIHEASRRDVSGWWHGFFSYVDSGPPAERLRELLALQQAGVIVFLGPRMTFDIDEAAGTFVARGPLEGHVVRAHSLIEARLPAPTLSNTGSPLLRSLFKRGLITQESTGTGKVLVGPGANVLNAMGLPQAGLFAVGAGVSGWSAGAFARPRSNAAPFRDSDDLARRLLSAVPAKTTVPEAGTMNETAFAAYLESAHSYIG